MTGAIDDFIELETVGYTIGSWWLTVSNIEESEFNLDY